MVKIHTVVFSVTTLCDLLGGYQCVQGTTCLHLQAEVPNLKVEAGCSSDPQIHWNISTRVHGIIIQDTTAWISSALSSSYSGHNDNDHYISHAVSILAKFSSKVIYTLYMELAEKTVNQLYHLKFNFQLKPPHVISEAVMYSNVSSDMTSIIGHTTVFL